MPDSQERGKNRVCCSKKVNGGGREIGQHVMKKTESSETPQVTVAIQGLGEMERGFGRLRG